MFGATEQLIIPGEGERAIMHGEIKIHDAVIMFAGGNEQWGEKTCGMFIYVDSVDRVYNAGIEQGGTSLTTPTQAGLRLQRRLSRIRLATSGG